MKTCKKCGVEKPHSEFFADKYAKGGLCPRCKECKREYSQKYYHSNKSRQKNLMLQRYFGLTVDVYNAMLDDCGGVCYICRRGFDVASKSTGPVVDHNHKTGEVRGIICGQCNFGIGNLRDDPEAMLRAADWVRGDGPMAEYRSKMKDFAEKSTAEYKATVSVARKGRRIHSEEHKESLRKSMTANGASMHAISSAKFQTEEYRQKKRLIQLGKKDTDEARENKRVAAIAREAAKREKKRLANLGQMTIAFREDAR